MADSITGTHLCSCPRTILLPFGLHHSPKYPQHPLVASTRKSTKQNIGCKRKKGMQSSNKLPLQTHQFILVVSLKTHGERERETAQTKCPHPNKAHTFFFFFNKGHKSQLLVHPLSKRKKKAGKAQLIWDPAKLHLSPIISTLALLGCH